MNLSVVHNLHPGTGAEPIDGHSTDPAHPWPARPGNEFGGEDQLESEDPFQGRTAKRVQS